MSLGSWLLFFAACLVPVLLMMYLCLWAAKKAGIKPGMGYYEKLFYDNCSGLRDTGRRHKHFSGSMAFLKKQAAGIAE